MDKYLSRTNMILIHERQANQGIVFNANYWRAQWFVLSPKRPKNYWPCEFLGAVLFASYRKEPKGALLNVFLANERLVERKRPLFRGSGR